MRVETGCTVTITCKIVYLYSTVYAQAKIFSSESYLLLNKNASSWHIHKGDENAHVQQAPQVQVPTLRFAHLRPPPPPDATHMLQHTRLGHNYETAARTASRAALVLPSFSRAGALAFERRAKSRAST